MNDSDGQTAPARRDPSQRRARSGWAPVLGVLCVLSACGTANAARAPECEAVPDAVALRVRARIAVTQATLTLPAIDGRLDCAGAGGHPCDPGHPPAAFRLAWDPRAAGACFEGHEFAVWLGADESLEAARPRLAALLMKAGGKRRDAQVEVTRAVERVNQVSLHGETSCVVTWSERVVVSVAGLGLGPFVSEVRAQPGYRPGTCEP